MSLETYTSGAHSYTHGTSVCELHVNRNVLCEEKKKQKKRGIWPFSDKALKCIECGNEPSEQVSEQASKQTNMSAFLAHRIYEFLVNPQNGYAPYACAGPRQFASFFPALHRKGLACHFGQIPSMAVSCTWAHPNAVLSSGNCFQLWRNLNVTGFYIAYISKSF